MEKSTNVKQKNPNKQPTKSKQPLKVVYITNPIKFKASSASEFRSLVQELTGKDSDVFESSKFNTPAQGGEQDKRGESSAAFQLNVHAPHHVPTILGQSACANGDSPQGSDFDPSFGSFVDGMHTPLMIEDFQGIMGSNLWEEASNFDEDVFKTM